MGDGHQALRKGRCSLRGQVYLVTFATRGRLPVFADAGVACVAARLILDSVPATDARLLAWVLMPDHWHGMVELGDATLACAVRCMKGASARQLRLAFPQLGPVWAPAYHERALRRDEDLLVAARYVVANPLQPRAFGLVASRSNRIEIKSSRLKPLLQGLIARW